MDDLLNWVWQGCLLTLAAQAALRVVAARRTRARLVVWWAALCLVLILPLISIVAARASSSAAGPDAAGVPLVLVPGHWRSLETALLAAWCTWSLVSVLRLAIALCALQRVKAQVRPVTGDLESRLRRWTSVKALGRPTRLVISPDVRSAAVLGGITPDVAVAPVLLARLSPDDLDRIVLHEWAHVQRRDDLANLVQVFIGVIAGWHPAVRWIDRQLRLERETACDEVAVSLSGSARGYAACLARLASLPLPARERLPVPGALSSSRLRLRVERILQMSAPPAPRWSPATVAALAAVSIAALTLSGWEIAGVAALRSGAPAVEQVRQAAAVPHSPAVLTPARFDKGSPGRPAEPVVTRPRRDTASGAPPHAPRGGGRTMEASELARTEAPAPEQGTATLIPVSSRPPAPWVISVPPDLFAVRDAQPGGLPSRTSSTWRTAADAGVALGRGSQNAALATAGFFTRFGRKVAESF